MNWLGRFMDVPSIDPDDARRRKLLNIILAGILVLDAVTLPLTVAADITGIYPKENVQLQYVANLGLSTGVVIIYLINRHWISSVASSLFLLLLTLVSCFSDEIEHVVQGRAMLVFSISIILASVLLRPWASFVMAGVVGAVLFAYGSTQDLLPDPIGLVVFFGVALASWLAANTMERAIRDLRTLNVELDQRVRDRTRELAESLARNEAIMDSMADGVVVFDTAGHATVANPAMASLLARPAQEIQGRDVETLMGEEVSAEDRERVAEMLEDREGSYSGIRFDWGRKTLAASLAPVRDNTNRVTGTVAVFRDFTREAEIDRMKSTFVSIASHELRTPLNAILGYTEMLEEGVYGELTDRQHGALERLMSNTGHMLGLVNNLLDRARIEAGTLELHLGSFSPPRLIEEVMSAMGVTAHGKSVQLTSRIEGDVPRELTGDYQRLHQILVNLVNNGIKFTDEGLVHVRLYRPDADHWAMEVSDTGRGIPKEAQSYIFDPFRQADESATREYGGAGLGLSIVKQLVELMEGEIRLESDMGKGSTFTVLLPIAAAGAEGIEGSGDTMLAPGDVRRPFVGGPGPTIRG